MAAPHPARSGRVARRRDNLGESSRSGEAAPAAGAWCAVRGSDIETDGRATEPPWLRAPVATGSTQFEPHEGEPATERTEARVLHGDDALHVATQEWESDARVQTWGIEFSREIARRDEISLKLGYWLSR